VLITGELDGIPGRVVEMHSQCGGLSVGVSPAHSAVEHAALYAAPPCPSTVVIYSGFGFKGRNVIAVRSADIVILVSGGLGTLNEFTIAYDEGKVIGILHWRHAMHEMTAITPGAPSWPPMASFAPPQTSPM
jgi:uncharacterized protein (TIGR00725 family)